MGKIWPIGQNWPPRPFCLTHGAPSKDICYRLVAAPLKAGERCGLSEVMRHQARPALCLNLHRAPSAPACAGGTIQPGTIVHVSWNSELQGAMHNQASRAPCRHVQLPAFHLGAVRHWARWGWLHASMWGSQHFSWELCALGMGWTSFVPASGASCWSAGSPLWRHGVGLAQWRVTPHGSWHFSGEPHHRTSV